MDEQVKQLVCVTEEVIADEETPVSVFRKLRAGAENAFLLESVEKGEIVGRYSFIGINPCEVLSFNGAKVTIKSNGWERTDTAPEGPLAYLRTYMRQYRGGDVPGIPLSGGAIGFLGYDTVRFIEKIPGHTDDRAIFPDGMMLIVDTLVVFDHISKHVTIVANTPAGTGGEAKAKQACREKIAQVRAKLEKPLEPSLDFRCPERDIAFKSNRTRDDYMAAVMKAKEYIHEGDIFQVVLSQRLETKVDCDPFNIYRNLRIMNPSPYMFYFQMDGIHLVGSSPEVLVRCDGRRINVRPIAGTRRRGATPEEDRALEAELLADEKERAEHLMLIDLGRNDVGRVARYGTVRVDEEFVVEKYSHVMHIVSNVIGEKREDVDAYDILAACFPAGTLSGAPKVRAMEIISELEPTRRGPYGGAVGYFGFNGKMDTCITIRTITVKDGTAYIQAGAGIVADSDPEREFVETMNKAKALMKAIRGTK
ncbi:MAG: anthranilate synthase component I [Planctomycetota bacterium]